MTLSGTAFPKIESFFDPATSTVTHLVIDEASGHAAIIDPVLDFDMASGRTSRDGAAAVLARAEQLGLTLDLVLETHVHADHLSAAPWIREQTGAKIGIGEHIRQVQAHFAALFNDEEVVKADASQFDFLFADGDRFTIGALEGRVIHTPGHTPACVSFLIGDALFVGDTLFMPDFGTARCDFPGGDARQLYRSVRRLLELPDETRMFLCHDYAPGGRAHAWETTVKAQRTGNIHVRDGISEDEFVAMRTERDAKLDLPTLILPSVQVNIRGGQLPVAEHNGVRYLKIPVDVM